MSTRRNVTFLAGLWILVVVTVACGGKAAQKITPPLPTLFSEPDSRQLETTQPDTQLSTTPDLSLPTATPQADSLTTLGDADYYFPARRTSRGGRPFRIGLLVGMGDPYHITLVRGARQSAVNLDVELLTQLPQNSSSSEQNQLLEALLARGDLDALLLSSVDTQMLLPALQKAASTGIILITLQTSLSEQAGLAPFYTIYNENHSGGLLACQALIQSLAASDRGNEKTPAPPIKLYIQTGKPGWLDPEARVQGCQEAIAQTGDIQLAGIDNHEDDPLKAKQQILGILAREPGLSGIVCTDLVCAQAASQAVASQGRSGKIKIVTFDATPEAVNLLRQGSIDFLVTPKPFAMGYVAVTMVTAALDGVTGLPSSLATGWEIITPQNLADPALSRWVYDTRAVDPQRSMAGLKIGFVAGINDPFYYTMQRGAQQTATLMGAELLSQFPTDWSAAEQAQMIATLSSQNDLAALMLVPTDPLALIPSLQAVSAAGIPVLALDTSLDSSFQPLATLSSNDQDGGYFACRSLAQAIGGRGKVYIQSVTAGITATDERERGCQRALSEFPEIILAAVNYNDDDPGKAQAQLGTLLVNHPDLAGVFCTNVLGAQAVGQYLGSQGLSGKVKVAAFDATAATQDLLRNGVIDLVVAQKPAEMGYLGVLWAAAWLDGVTDLPAQVSTGFVLLTRGNMDDPEFARYFYTK